MSHLAHEWAEQLRLAAPGAPATLVAVLAQVLAGPAQSDALLIIGDALVEASKEQKMNGLPAVGAVLWRLSDVLRTEAPRRA